MFGTKFGIGDIKGYNANLNDHLARKKTRYKTIRDEQLDLVIVVNRLLTGFDAPCLSTVFIDRQPMHPHDIIQTFSRTNRLFDKPKTVGHIVTFQSPHKFKEEVDNALILYSAGGQASALAPDWDTIQDKFKKALAYLRVTAQTPDVIPSLSKEGELRFAKAFQEFDNVYASLKAFTKYPDNPPESYGITQDEYNDYAAHYKNIREKYKPDPTDPNPAAVDLEYELQAYSQKTIESAERPFGAIIGGAKVSSKLDALTNIVSKVDFLIIGGGMAFTFLKANGHSIGNSLLEEELIDSAKDIMKKAKEKNVTILLPVDIVGAQ